MSNLFDICTKIISDGENVIDCLVQTEVRQCYARIDARCELHWRSERVQCT